MDTKELRNLIKMIIESDITEFEMEEGDKKVTIRRFAQPAVQSAPAGTFCPPPPVPASSPGSVAQSSSTPMGASETAVAKEEAGEKLEEIKSPIVGTFYRAPSPDSEPYVEVGSVVEKGQILCIVEAMKLMNEIEADFKCRIKEVLKENSQPVEYGEVLFLVERL
ncbi:MAG: acetyl-CoA carboxylase biotin carboxyl carrier protein [Desulfuromonadaceae bacterium]|nr:acetyl-CoA carboxylase biotin carboxyl carrier protein [Desulfuromonadaceae bacterium]